ncbi:HNH endonuclease [Polaromonas jejuensis]|uniref:HNH endonuclease n=1 Tax=Polaromonas jejuensis TaxID=457502 RepID=A0ABW0QED8_9BURK|nr:HNH endonuclease signature motif containing protein [Polaromonas jejuensis]
MEKSFLTMRYYETYYYANIVHNVLSDPFPYIRHVHNWYEDREQMFLTPFPKWSVLHDFAEYSIRLLIDEQDGSSAVDRLAANAKADLWIDRAMRHHAMNPEGFRRWASGQGIKPADVSEDDISSYYEELNLTGQVSELIEHLAKEVFYVLFNNRGLLANLNDLVAGVVRDLDPLDCDHEISTSLEGTGRLKRVAIPRWVQRTVLYRDKGLCASCSADIRGLMNSQPDAHYDHIVPLAQHGINDVTNIQLLCSACNLRKGRQPLPPSDRYLTWY